MLKKLIVAASILFVATAHGEENITMKFPPPAPTLGPQHRDGCSCGSLSVHHGVDWNAEDKHAAIPVADDGVVVAVEENESALVYAPTAGYCGRYVVVEHTYSNGKILYTRYTQLGDIVDGDGNPIRVGQKVNGREKIGEVGKWGMFHFEVRPATESSITQDAKTLKGLGIKIPPWAMYSPVDPRTFSFAQYAGRVATER